MICSRHPCVGWLGTWLCSLGAACAPKTDCSVCFNDAQTCVEPDFDGYVFYHLLAGRNSFGEIRCNDNHIQLARYGFEAPLGHATYFGSFYVTWYAPDYFQLHKHLVVPLPGEVPIAINTVLLVIERVTNDGVARVAVKDERNDVFQKFTRRTYYEGPLNVSLPQLSE